MCSAIAFSSSRGGASGSGTGGTEECTTTSISSTWSACGYCGGTPKVRGYASSSSTISRRSGSAAARCSSRIVWPACSDRLHIPSASGGVAIVVITRGCARSMMGVNRR